MIDFQHACLALGSGLQALHDADLRANPGAGLVDDRPRAVAAIDAALDDSLAAFVALLESVDAQFPDVAPNWLADTALALPVVLRSARVGAGSCPRTLYRWHAEEAPRPTAVLHYVFVDFDYVEERRDAFDLFLSAGDLADCLAMPAALERFGGGALARLRDYLGCDHYARYAEHHGLPPARVFFNLVPLLINAGAALFPALGAVLAPGTTAAEWLGPFFARRSRADTVLQRVDCAPFVLPA